MWASSSATDSRLPAPVATAMWRSRCSSASQQADLVVSCGQVRRIKHLAEVTLPLVFPTRGDGHGFDHVGGGAPALLGGLMQVARGQVLPFTWSATASVSDVVTGPPPAGAAMWGAAFHVMKRAKPLCEILIRDSYLRLRVGLLRLLLSPEQVPSDFLYNPVRDGE